MSHLLFTDDSILFFQAMVVGCNKIPNILKKFEEVIKTELNKDKSIGPYSFSEKYKRRAQTGNNEHTRNSGLCCC